MDRGYLVATLALVVTFAGASSGFRTLKHITLARLHQVSVSPSSECNAAAARAAVKPHTHLRAGDAEEAQLLAEMNLPMANLDIRIPDINIPMAEMQARIAEQNAAIQKDMARQSAALAQRIASQKAAVFTQQFANVDIARCTRARALQDVQRYRRDLKYMQQDMSSMPQSGNIGLL